MASTHTGAHPKEPARRGPADDTVGRRLGCIFCGLVGLACLGLVFLVAAATRYDGPLGLRAYAIDGQTYRPQAVDDYVETGIASWYGAPFHGRPAANGQTYDQHGFTAAHRTLPLGSPVRVTRLDSGRSVLLRITDRGPFVEGRIIDVSLRAAKQLGFVHDGLARVRVELLHSPL